jgi:hypothetical protein
MFEKLSCTGEQSKVQHAPDKDKKGPAFGLQNKESRPAPKIPDRELRPNGKEVNKEEFHCLREGKCKNLTDALRISEM